MFSTRNGKGEHDQRGHSVPETPRSHPKLFQHSCGFRLISVLLIALLESETTQLMRLPLLELQSMGRRSQEKGLNAIKVPNDEFRPS